jgi:hypothetical protein
LAVTAQFERTLIVAEDDAYVSYLEGCTAPAYDTNQLHAAVVELSAGAGAEIKYSTVQNWYAGDAEGRGGIYNFVTKRGLCHGDRSKISWTQVGWEMEGGEGDPAGGEKEEEGGLSWGREKGGGGSNQGECIHQRQPQRSLSTGCGVLMASCVPCSSSSSQLLVWTSLAPVINVCCTAAMCNRTRTLGCHERLAGALTHPHT